MVATVHFHPETFAFLRELAKHNRREWFQANKQRYQEHVRDPAVRFITTFAEPLERISPHFRADPRPVGGSLFRIYRDTRFSKDKRPFKTHVGIQFRHGIGKDVHAPGFYLHLEPDSVFLAAGIWHPDTGTLRKIRDALVEDPAAWKRAAYGKRFQTRFELEGDTLTRAPRGYDPEHPLIDDLKRKDFIGVALLTEADAIRAGFVRQVADLCRLAGPFVKHLCTALAVPF